MSFSRYRSDPIVRIGTLVSSNRAMRNLRIANAAGAVSTKKYVLKEGERLDTVAFREFGDGRLWWVIAIFSNIGWWLQAPAGTLLSIPTDINDIAGIV